MAANADLSAALPRSWTPAGTTDSHCHVFGVEGQYPTVPSRYSLPKGTIDDYLGLTARVGIERTVFVQPGIYGADNSCIFDALRRLGPKVARGIAGIGDEAPSDATLADWHTAGMRGFRVNFTPVKAYEPGFAATVRPRIARVGALARQLGWNLDVLAPNWLILELLPDLEALEIDYTFAHFCKLPAAGGAAQPEARAIIAHFAASSRCWIKLSGPYHVSDDPGFADVIPLARELIASAPDRVLWGSDWPHNLFVERADTVGLVDQLRLWAPDPTLQRKILVDNPARLFGF